MIVKTFFSRRGIVRVGAGAIVLSAAFLLIGQVTSAGPNEEPTASTIMQEGGPTGDELAARLGLELQQGFTGNCSYFAEINDSHEGYCLEGLAGDNNAQQWVIAEALRGRVLTAEELAQVEKTLREVGSLPAEPG
jgi:hypothetical protein